MILKKVLPTLGLLIFLSSCQIGYYFSSGMNQWKMANTREPIDEALLKKHTFTEDQKNKILLSQKARLFAFEKLKLKQTKNYSTYIDLGRPYVTWVVQAAEKWEMKNYEWSYPIVGKMPFKGYFNEADAVKEAGLMREKGYDTYVRGVAAYSTLGWFQDSLLSSMLRYKEHDLVNTIIHEIVHSTIYIKNNADFNEKLAVFIGAKGSEKFYRELEGEKSKTLELIKNENADDVLFAQFVSTEIASIDTWYLNHKKELYTSADELERESRLSMIIDHFSQQLKPTLKTNAYFKFEKEKMNNARLGLYKTYMENLDDFEVLYKKLDSDLLKFIEVVKTLETSEDPEADLKRL